MVEHCCACNAEACGKPSIILKCCYPFKVQAGRLGDAKKIGVGQAGRRQQADTMQPGNRNTPGLPHLPMNLPHLRGMPLDSLGSETPARLLTGRL